MFGRSIHLFTISGFRISVDWSWFIVLVLVVWSLGSPDPQVGVFSRLYPGMSAMTYWIMGAVGALGLFTSIVLHELGHALAARRVGVEMRGITLFIFGGVAEMTAEPPNARAEFIVAVAGPIVSVLIAAGSYGMTQLSGAAGWPRHVMALFEYLAFINFLLVAFNMIPAFPLDGGRVLRSILWHFKKNLRWATRITASIGAGFGYVLIGLGVLNFLNMAWIAGLWYVMLGMFLRHAANMSYEHVLVRRLLEGEPVERFMHPEPRTVPQSISVRELVEQYIYRYHFKMFPVVDDGHLIGCVTTRDVKGLPPEEWDKLPVARLTKHCDVTNTVGPKTDAMEALAKMQRTGQSRMLVVERGVLRGIITLKDLMRLISLKMELEREAGKDADEAEAEARR